MKKIITIISCLCLLLVCIAPAYAADDAVFTVKTTADPVSRGDTIKVEVEITSSQAYSAMGFKLDFDANTFQFVPDSGETHVSDTMILNFDESKFAFALAFSKAKAYSGKLLSFELKVKSDAPFEPATVSIKEVRLGGVTYSVNGAKVTMTCKHEYTTWTKVDGETHKSTCSLCKANTETQKHTWDAGTITKGDCETPGEKTYKCTANGCDATKVEPVKAPGHDWDDGTFTKGTGCEDPSEKTYQCKNCGATKVESVKATGHVWDKGSVTKSTGCETPGEMTYKCTVKGCNATKVEAIKVTGHSWDNGTVTKKATCETAGEMTYSCKNCDATRVETIKATGHAWDDGTVTKSASCEVPGEKTYQCKNCDATQVETIEATGHAWDSECDNECNNGCGTKRDVKHKYAEEYSHDEKGHWYPCTLCGDKLDHYDHTPDRDAPTEVAAQLCKYCGYVMAEKLPHEHDPSSAIEKDEEGHWYFCNKEGCEERIDFAEHVYEDACDQECNVCDYTRIPPHQYMPEWRGSQEGHWQVCALCGNESEIYPHTPGEPATEENPQVCVDCNYWIQWPMTHEHTYNDGWEQDAQGHWQVCTECMSHSEHQEHTWDEGTVTRQPTDTQEGEKKFVCTVCQGEKTESIPALNPTEPSQPTEPSLPTAPSEPHTPGDPVEGEFPWWIVGAAAGVLLLIGIVLLVIELIRSRKVNMNGKFSK